MVRSNAQIGQCILSLRVQCREDGDDWLSPHVNLVPPVLARMPNIEEIELCGAYWRDPEVLHPSTRDIPDPLQRDALPHLYAVVFNIATASLPRLMTSLFSSRGAAGLRILHLGSASPIPARDPTWGWFDDAAPTLKYLGFTAYPT
ncbi:hypothetical protein CERSUDRAFT_71624 [Gelatoporia subvermispora B]|uniref:Uncharacterized protein n=1 Tax=Ceriporiopsis subvermispora (strain B) TaxID=914234 RepID=M2RLM2_CERS8|nr:hypothetical protein CERSUDRAFT_71624 [Gelatoporia subvermispora B]